MLAMIAERWGEPSELRLVDLPDPTPGPGEVAVDVRAIGCNFFDILMVIGFASGTIPTVQLNRVLLKNISIVGLHWGAYRQHEPERIGQATAAPFELYESGAVRPVVSSTHPLAEAAAGLAEIATRCGVGKVVLVP